MANINIFGTLFNAAGTAIVKGEQVEGGYSVVADTDARNAIPLSIIKVGSLVYCQSDGIVYKCSAIDGNEVTWEEFNAGGSMPMVNADLEYNLSIEVQSRDEVKNVTTTLVSFAFDNNEMPDVDYANIKVNTTLNFTFTQYGESQTAVYHIESYGTFTKMNMTDGTDQQRTWIHITVPAFEQHRLPSNIELVGINGRYDLFNDFGYFANKLYEKANKEDLATVATSGDYDDLTNKPTIPTKTSDLENDMKFVSIAEPINVEGYKQLLYIEANGAQAIETSIIPNQNTSFDLDYMSYDAPTSSNSPQIINAGGRGTQPRMAVSLWVANKLSGEVMINTTSSTAKMSANVRSLLRYVNDGTSKKIIYSDNTSTNLTINNFEAVGSLILFALKNGDIYDRFFNGRLYGLKLYNQTTLTHNFVPAMRLSDNEVGLLDVEDNNTFYTNNGTGTFGYGELSILSRVSELVMDRNIITDNNFTNAYKNQIQQNANDIADIQALLPTLAGLNLAVVNELPTQDISTSTIYLVPKSESGTNNIYDEYIYVNNAWEKIGDTELDLSNYIQKAQTATGLLKDDGTVDTTTYQEELIGEQTTGQNIKTINGTSILGSGNIEIQGGGSEYDIDTLNSYLIVYDGDDSYFVPITKLTKPNTPTITTTTVNVITGDGSFNVTTDSGSTAYYKIADSVAELDGQTYSAVSSGRISFASGYSNNSDNTDVVKYVKLKATKNGVESDESSAIELTIHPKVAKPSLVTNNTDKYISTATVVISKSASANATTEYSEDGGTTWTELTESSITITVTENKLAGAYKVRATKTNYTNSDIAQSSAITLNKPYTYYGVTNATISASVVADLTKVAEEKSEWKVGSDYIKSLSYTAAAEHAVFAYPSEYGVLTHILDPNGYENISGWSMSTLTINGVGYNVYRTDDKLTCNNFVYRFQF